MNDKKQTGKLIEMSNLARKPSFEFDAEAILAESIAKIQARRKEKPPSFQARQLINAISTPEHLRKVFEDGQADEILRETKK